MVNPLGNTTNTGKTGDLGTEYEVQWSRYKARQRVLGTTDFKSNLFMNGIDGDVVLQQIENHIEGDDSKGNGKDKDLLNWDSYLESNNKKNDILFQSEDTKTYTNVDFNNNKYEKLDEKGFTEKIGMNWENTKPYDAFEISQNKINFYEFKFSGIGGEDKSQENLVINLNDFDNARWGLQNFVIREVDTSYWGKTVDNTNSESVLSHESLDVIKQAMPQWMTDEIKAQLSQYKEGTVEYNSKFYAAAIKLMDQEKAYNGTFV